MWIHVLLLVSAHGEVETDGPLLVVDDLNLAELSRTFGDLFILFHDLDCGTSQMAIQEFKKAAKLPKPDGLKFGSFEIGDNPSISVAFNVWSVPTYLYITNMTAYEYKGPKSPAAMSEWANNKKVRSSHIISNYPDLQQFLQKHPVAFVLFTKDESPLIDYFFDTIKFEEGNIFTVSTHPTALSHLKVQQNSLVVFKHADDKQKELIDLSPEPILNFVKTERISWTMPLGEAALQYFFDKENPGLFVLRPEQSAAEFKGIIDAAAAKVHEDIKICYADLEKEPGLSDLLGLRSNLQPTALILDTKERIVNKYHLNSTVTTESLVQFVQDWKKGSAFKFLKTTTVLGDEGEIARANFNSVVMDEEQDVFVHFYAPWCNHCKKVNQTLSYLQEEYPSILFTKIDAINNDIESEKIVKFPTLKLYTTSNKKGILFEGTDFSDEAITMFLDRHVPGVQVNKDKRKDRKKDKTDL